MRVNSTVGAKNQRRKQLANFWTDNYMKAYQDLETKLAAKYDSALELLEVVTSACTTVLAILALLI